MTRYPRFLGLGGWRWLKLLIPVVLLRVAALVWSVTNVDETTFFVFGKLLSQGALPYVDVVDNKPLLAYLAFAPAGLIGWHLWPLHLLAMGWIVATAAALCRTVAFWTGDVEAGWTAAWLTVLITCCGIPAISTELLFNLPLALALLCTVRATRGVWGWGFAAGVWIAIASLFKHQAGVALVAFAIGIFLERRSLVDRVMRKLDLFMGFLVPWGIVAIIFVALGCWPELYEWNVTRNFAYSSHDPTSHLRLLGEGVLMSVVLAAPVAWVLAVRSIRREWSDAFGRSVVILLGLTVVAVSVGGRFYLHYFLQFVPPLAVLAAPEATALLRHPERVSAGTRRLLAAGVLVPIVFWAAYGPIRGLLGAFPAQEPKAREIASWVREHSKPDERVFLWGSYSPVYYLAERLPGTRYIDSAVLVGNFDPSHVPDGFDTKPYQSDADVRVALADMERNRPALFIDTASANLHDWRHFPLADVPALDEYVQRNYVIAGRPAGAVVYRRR